MKTWLLIAWRNIFRHRVRSFLTGLLMGVSAAVLVFFICLQNSSYQSAINATVSLLTGHIQLQNSSYFEKPQIEKSIRFSDEVVKTIERSPELVAFGRRAMGFALLSAKNRSYGAQIVGVEPEAERKLSSIPGRTTVGDFFEANNSQEMLTQKAVLQENVPAVVLGKILARKLGVALGDELTLLGQGHDGSLSASVLRVSGMFESGSDILDGGVAMMRLPAFQEVFSMADRYHSLVIRLDPRADVSAIQEWLSSHTQLETGQSFYRWDQILPGLREAIYLDMAAGWVFYLSLIMVTAFSAFNTFLMIVLERKKEFALMLALGSSPYGIAGTILFEALLLGFVSLTLGAILGMSIVTYFGIFGFAIPGTEELLKHWNLPSRVYPYLTFFSVIQGPVAIMISVLLAAVYPGLKALRIDPVRSLAERG